MFADQTIELLPARTTMQTATGGAGGNGGVAVSANVLNFGLLQKNVAVSNANGGDGGAAVNILTIFSSRHH